jgi:hypothetical protein
VDYQNDGELLVLVYHPDIIKEDASDNTRFDEQLKRKKCKPYTITPLVSMSIATLERSMRLLSKMSFSEVLEDRIRKDKATRCAV